MESAAGISQCLKRSPKLATYETAAPRGAGGCHAEPRAVARRDAVAPDTALRVHLVRCGRRCDWLADRAAQTVDVPSEPAAIPNADAFS